MALSTYTELQASLASWAHSDAYTAAIVDCIKLAEATFNRRLRTQWQETALSATAIDGSYQIAIPSNTLAVKALWRTDEPYTPLRPQSLEWVIARQINGDTASHYCTESSTWRFDGTGTVAGVLYRDIPALASNSTNWLLTAHPSLYLYGALAELAILMRDAEMANIAKGQVDQRIAELNRSAQNDAFSGPLVVRAG